MNDITEENLKVNDNEPYFQTVIFGRPNEKHRFDLEMALFGLRRTVERELKSKYVYFREVYTSTVQQSLLEKALKLAETKTIDNIRLITNFFFINTTPSAKFLEEIKKNPDTVTFIINYEENLGNLVEQFATQNDKKEMEETGCVVFQILKNKEYFADECVDAFAQSTDTKTFYTGLTRSPYNFFKVINEDKDVEYDEL